VLVDLVSDDEDPLLEANARQEAQFLQREDLPRRVVRLVAAWGSGPAHLWPHPYAGLT
jgi:hypothetical protein